MYLVCILLAYPRRFISSWLFFLLTTPLAGHSLCQQFFWLDLSCRRRLTWRRSRTRNANPRFSVRNVMGARRDRVPKGDGSRTKMEREDHRSAITVSSSSPIFSILRERERERLGNMMRYIVDFVYVSSKHVGSFHLLPLFFRFCRERKGKTKRYMLFTLLLYS